MARHLTVIDERSLQRLSALMPDHAAAVASLIDGACRRPPIPVLPAALIRADLGPGDASRCAPERTHHVVEVRDR